MNKIIIILLLGSMASSTYANNYMSTTAAVTVAGGIIKAQSTVVIDKKYKRKDCPVCKGTGKYLSGDGIKMVDCGYCEPEKTETVKQKIVVHPQAVITQECQNGVCVPKNRNVR